MVIKSGCCAVCGSKLKISFDDEPFTQDINLNNYEKIKNINLSRCAECGYVSEFLFDKVDEKIVKLVNSDVYKKALDNHFLGEYKTIPEVDYSGLIINELEAYSFVTKELGNNYMSERVFDKISDNKLWLANACYEAKSDYPQYIGQYDQIIESLANQAQNDNEQCLNFLRGVKITEPICKIFVVERLCYAHMTDQAKLIIDKLSKKINISKDLLKYIQELTGR